MIPYTLEEMKLVVRLDSQVMDIYHRELMKWAIQEIEELRRKLDANRNDPD